MGFKGKLVARRTEDAAVDDIVTGRWARHCDKCRDESKWETIELWELDEEQRFSPAALIIRKMENYASSHLIIFVSVTKGQSAAIHKLNIWHGCVLMLSMGVLIAPLAGT